MATTSASSVPVTFAGAPSTIPGRGSLRFVNLFAFEGPPPAVDVYRGFNDASGRPVVGGLGFGRASDYLSMPEGRQSFTVYRQGSTTDDGRIGYLTPNVPAKAVVTVLVQSNNQTPNPTFFELGSDPDGGGTGSPPPPGKALIWSSATAVQRLFSQSSVSFRYGIPGVGCLSDTLGSVVSDPLVSIYPVAFAVEPGPRPVAAYSAGDRQCSAPPVAGPVPVNLVAGSTYLVFLYGTGIQVHDLKLLVLPTRRS